MVLTAISPPRAEPALRGSNGAIYAVSSFGVDFTTFGRDFNPSAHFDSERYAALNFADSYPACRSHDRKLYDWEGRFVSPGSYRSTQPFIGSALPSTYVPLDQRRPSNPYRLARLIQKSFTSLVFGEERFPSFKSADAQTQDFANALAQAADAKLRMVQARNIGGACGTCGISWRFYEGQVRMRVHAGKKLIPHAWRDRDAFDVEHVSELTRSVRVEWNARTKKEEEVVYIGRRDWTPTADIVFLEVRADDDEPTWIVDEDNTFVHDDGFPHFVWVRNGGDDDGGESIDGTSDVEGLYEECDGVDILKSVLNKGTVKNLDPTLVLKLDAVGTEDAKKGVEKGSGRALNVGATGDAKYLELAGTATTTGLALLAEDRDHILEVAQCVVPSHAELTSAGTSSVAQKMLFAPMLGAGSVHRTVYGGAYLAVMSQMIESARRRYPSVGEDGEPVYPLAALPAQAETSEDAEQGDDVQDEQGDDEPELVPTEFYLDLPPKVVTEPVTDEHGAPTDETTTTITELHPGSGRLELVWPPWFEPTSLDLQQDAQSVSTAAGGKPVISQQTAVEIMARKMKLDPAQEWSRVQAEAKAASDATGAMFPGTGPSKEHEQAEGGEGSKPNNFQSPAAQARASAEKLVDKVHTANEVRARMGSGPLMRPDGSADPNADLPLPAFLALQTAGGQAAGQATPSNVVPDAPDVPAASSPAEALTSPEDAPAGAVAPAEPPAEPDASTGQGEG